MARSASTSQGTRGAIAALAVAGRTRARTPIGPAIRSPPVPDTCNSRLVSFRKRVGTAFASVLGVLLR